MVVFRLFNTVGPRQTGRYGMVVPRFVDQALRGEPLTVYGDGEQTRCFLHVKDAVQAIIALAESPDAVGQVFNVGSTEEVSILELANGVLRTVDRFQVERSSLQAFKPSNDVASDRVVLVPYDEAYEAGFEDMQRRVPDISKIRELVGWEPSRSLDDILQDVVAWAREQRGGEAEGHGSRGAEELW